jgi:hypothetical protein
MLTVTSRRGLLGGALLVLLELGSACARRPPPSVAPTPPATSPELESWTAQARAMLADGLQTLRTFDDFAAYRVSITPSSGMRSASELVWDPPTGHAWDDATHVARGLRGRADQLFQAVSTSQIDPNVWREQRALADVVHDLGGVGDALAAYRDRIDRLPPGDASGVLSLLDTAWKQWDEVATRMGLSRSEPIACAS